MNLYLLLPMTACVASAMLTIAVLGRDGTQRANWVAAALTFGATLWSFCEVVWNASSDPERVLTLVRISSAGWVAMGPLGLHLFLELTGRSTPITRPLMAGLYATSAVFLLITLGTEWMHTGVIRTSWGWGYEFGPAYPPFWAFTTVCLGVGLAIAIRHLRNTVSAAERSQAGWIIVGVTVPLVMASLTDGILPMFGVQVPRLGTASFTFLGATVLWSFYRYGYTLLAPGLFAREILATLPDGVALLRLDGRIRAANPGLARLVGRSTRDLEGADMARLLPDVCFDPGETVDGLECLLRRATDDEIAVAVSTSVLRDKQRQPLGLVLVVRDLREVAALRSRLVTSGRLAAVGELAAGVAHEINNPIAFVRSNLAAIEEVFEKFDDGPTGLIEEGRELLEESIEGVERVTAIVRGVRDFAHQGSGSREAIALNDLLDSVLRVAAPKLRNGGRVERRYGSLPPIEGSPQELQQVFLNLIVNACQAIGHEGRIVIETEHEGPWVIASVEDDGPGIPPDVVDRIFDPFFTTKPVGQGCGLGLGISYQLVRKHDGDLVVRTELGRGTRFSVRLPVPAQPG
ncbi:MAG: PAS domain-containing protein [Myxococcales bacterium]|nr:PAS domain-containing protein [Myxococcales bacterium]